MPKEDSPIIEVSTVSRIFGSAYDHEFVALENVDLTIKNGEFVCFVGASGCGKSTLLNIIAGLLKPTTGTVKYAGNVLTGVNRDAGYLTQSDSLMPWRSVARNVGLGLELRRVSRSEQMERVGAALASVGLEKFASYYPAQLSGGMRKRALLARTLIYEPNVLLLDEPFGALDALLRADLQADLLDLWQRHSRTTLFVTHDLEEALLLADRIVMFAPNPGRIVRILENPLPRPRSLLDLRESEDFGRLWADLWHTLEVSR